jgi:ATP synthase protein I
MDGNGQRDGRGDGSGPATEDDLSRRLERLGADLDAREQRSRVESAPTNRQNDASAFGLAFRLSAEFVAGVLAGGGVGFVVDRLTGWAPWGLIVCLLLGFCAGMLNLLRATGSAKPARSRRGR